MRRTGVMVLLVMAALVGGARGQSATPLAQDPAVRARLQALRPESPEAYLRLGEDVAAAVGHPEDVVLARTLLVLAYELDRTRTNGRGLGGSALLALAELSSVGHERRWLLATARRIDERYVPRAVVRERASVTDASAAYAAATALGLVRKGDGIAARQVLSAPGVAEAIDAARTHLPDPAAVTVSGLLAEADRWPCRECRNSRVVRRGGGERVEFRLCGTCRGDPGPVLGREQLTAHLLLESTLLGAQHATFGAQFVSDSGAPLLDPDPGYVAGALRIDARRTLWRDGAWVLPDGMIDAGGVFSPPALIVVPEAEPEAEPEPEPEPEAESGEGGGSG